ncbi:MAG: 2-amino-4-hydroxy-6-hydroxymethyldihydropteridine diphosphokinase [Anaerolineales bacterium]|jgi:2-amino-4-hydroxy-6-hydroxymethyldihydropteridine diphosphokinase|nr:2-amino-4-hydroxy-6-hydroxymethyldihydropteridine diphosphokinase [Anaerolineales bacterium]
MSESLVYIALGSNLGNRLANLRGALARFAPQISIRQESNVYETEPWGYADQPAFLNMVVEAATSLGPAALLSFLKEIEAEMGRAATFRNGPRLIDLDILFYDDLVLNSPPLVIPHPRLHERAFVLVPLADVAPQHLHPVLGETVLRLLMEIDLKGITRYIELPEKEIFDGD